MADEKKKPRKDDNPLSIGGTTYGDSPDVNEETMTASNRIIKSVSQAVSIGENDILDARKLILAAQRITAKKQGAPPYNQATLKSQGKNWKRNISTRFLQKELNRAAPRFYMPVLSASVLTAAELPAGWPKGQEKTKFFRDTVTQAIRSWRKNDMLWRGAGAEVCDFGYAFMCWTDPLEWRPHLARMDRGFVPKGTEIMDDKLARFTLKWDYRPDELLKIVRDATDAGSEKWKKDSAAKAVDHATLPTLPQDMSRLRKWEEMIRQQAVDFNYSRTQRMIETRHQWFLEYSGKVSHYLTWPGGPKDSQLLFEDLDAYDGTDQVVIPLVFGYGDGTIQGSMGAGQLLYDLAAQVEKVRNDGIDNLLNSNKARLQVASAKDVATAQLAINDTTIIATGATFAQNIGGISGDPKGYMVLDDKMTQWAQEIVGSYLPPMPSQASKAATAIVEQAQQREQEIQRDVLESWLKQVALVVAEMTRRMLNKDSDDEFAQGIRKKLLGDNVGWLTKTLSKLSEKISVLKKIIPPAPIALSEEELEILINQPAVQSVTDFTEWAASQRAQFAASVQNNPLFNQDAVARYMAAGVPNAGQAFVDSIVVPTGDITSQTVQERQQQMENTTMAVTGQPVKVALTDNHYVHWQQMQGPLQQVIQGGAIPAATAGLQHAAAHFAAGQSTKTWPPDKINEDKATLARFQQALQAKEQEIAVAKAAQVQQQPGALAPVEQMQPTG